MPRPRRALPRALPHALLATLLLLAAAPAVAGAAPPAPPPTTMTGTYELLAVDHTNDEGGLTHHYREVLRVPGRAALPLRLRAGHGLKAGERVRISAQPVGTSGTAEYDVTSVTRLAPASTIGSTGTTSVLVILAYWTAPDSMTRTRAGARFFDDGDRWYREVSYGKAGLAGVVTPWVRIPAPSGGRCLAGAEEMLGAAQVKAKALGSTYDSTRYDRTVLYFPRCSGYDTRNVAGWAYEPGTVSWLNGTMDRRTTVHEQGHNYGMGHAKSLACKSSTGARVTFSRSCVVSEYGDPYDAMGRSSYAAHVTGYRKEQAGWLGSRKRVLSSSAATTFTLPPFERVARNPNVVVANSPTTPGRSYWLEYRRPIGMDARLPSGATGGVLVHIRDGSRFGLLDLSPRDASMATAVLKPGTTWTSPDRVRFRVGYMSSSGARVTVTGAKAPPKPPSPPRYVRAIAGDALAEVTWQRPSSTGGSAITRYHVRLVDSATGSVDDSYVTASHTATTVYGLENGHSYAVSVRAGNSAGWSSAATATVRPVEMAPTVRLVGPAAGATVRDRVLFSAAAAPHPVSQAPIAALRFYVSGHEVALAYGGATTAYWNSTDLPNGDYTMYVVAEDTSGRTAVDGPFDLRVSNPYPIVTITSPVPGTYEAWSMPVTAEASVPDDPSVTVSAVEIYDRTSGWPQYVGADMTAPYEVTWPLGWRTGTRTVVARVRGSNGLYAWSEPVSVEITQPPPTVTVTSPAQGATLSGPSVTLTADAASHAAGASVAYVEFWSDYTFLGRDTAAPYSLTWDTSRLSGAQSITARVYEDNGRSVRSEPVGITLANAPPALTMTSPYNGQRLDPRPVTISGTARATTGGQAPDRVAVTVDGTALGSVAPAADGTWTLPWDPTTVSYGSHRIDATAYTPEGLASGTRVAWVEVVYPAPAIAIESPASYAQVTRGTTVDVVVSVTPHQYAVAGVAEICATVESAPAGCVTAPGADGRYRIPWTVAASSGYRYVSLAVRLTDGVRRYAERLVLVAGVPGAPGLTVVPGDGEATVTVTAPAAWEPIPVTGYTVTVGATEYPMSAPGTFTATGLANGTTYAVTAVARNAAGTGAAATRQVVPRAPTRVEYLEATEALRYREDLTVVARLSSHGTAVPGETVELWSCDRTGFCQRQVAGTTGADGVATLTFTAYAVTWVDVRYPGRPGLAPSAGPAHWPVMSAAVTASLSASTVSYGSTATLRGTAAPYEPGDTVVLERLVSTGGWQRVTTGGLNTYGAVSFPLTYGRGTWRFRLTYAGDLMLGTSDEVTLTVV